jgi:predicted site-specific integrase-resolvase
MSGQTLWGPVCVPSFWRICSSRAGGVEAAGVAVTSGGGMNLRREKFLALMDAVDRGEVATVVVAHKNRLARFGFELREHVAARSGCEIIVAKQEATSPQHELLEDLLAVLPTLSCRLYGMRRYEKELEGADLTAGDDR